MVIFRIRHFSLFLMYQEVCHRMYIYISTILLFATQSINTLKSFITIVTTRSGKRAGRIVYGNWCCTPADREAGVDPYPSQICYSVVFGMPNPSARSSKGVFSWSLFSRARWIAPSQSLFARFVGGTWNLGGARSKVWWKRREKAGLWGSTKCSRSLSVTLCSKKFEGLQKIWQCCVAICCFLRPYILCDYKWLKKLKWWQW